MTIEKFITIVSRVVPLPVENIDTDQIIPARFLKATSKEGFGKNLFRDWRYDRDGGPIQDFPLNDSQYSGSILVAGKNFGCGSSREHAAWAVADYGFRVVISSFFADIFINNVLNNGILPIQVSGAFLEKIFRTVTKDATSEVEVNLEEESVSLVTTGESESFEINGYKKHCLLNGYDDVDFLVSKLPEIEAFEKAR